MRTVEPGTGRPVRRFDSTIPLTAMAWTPDGKALYVGRADGCLLAWKADDGSTGAALPAGAGEIRALAVSSDGSMVAVGGKDRVLALWKVGSDIRHLKGHTDGIFKMAFHPDGRRLASSSADSTIRIWALD